MSAGAKRALAEEDAGESSVKKSRVDADALSSVTVYQPNVVISELAKKMNSLVEVCACPSTPLSYGQTMSLPAGAQVLLPARYLTGETKQVKLRQLWGEGVPKPQPMLESFLPWDQQRLALRLPLSAGTDVYTDDSDLVAVLVRYPGRMSSQTHNWLTFFVSGSQPTRSGSHGSC